jgi:hypothetical protein
MTIRLPVTEDQHWPMFRLLTQPRYSPTGSWTVRPMLQREDLGTGANGFYIESFSRVCLPAIGEASIRFHYGIIDGRLFSDDPNDTTGNATAPDLVGHEIRIQAAPHPSDAEKRAGLDGFVPQWRTVWWGTCEHHVDTLAPGAGFSHGQRQYLCLDGFYRAKRWHLRRHGLLQGGRSYAHVEGNPGYNFSWWDGYVAGNRDGSAYAFPGDGAVSVDYHCLAGTFNSGQAQLWTDLQAATHAVHSARGINDPVFAFVGSTDALTVGKTCWPVDDQSDTAWDLVARICDRRRGRGVVFVDWADDLSAPTGPLQVRMMVRPQFKNTLNISLNAGTASITGAQAAGTVRAVDLIGDHRNVMPMFRMTDRHQHVVDYIESVGEPIEVLATLSYVDGSLVERWDDAEFDRFLAITDPLQRLDARWMPVCQLHGVPNGWNYLIRDGNGGTPRRIDVRCDDFGNIIQPGLGDEVDTSILLCEILRDLPVYDSFDYRGSTPARWDGALQKQIPSRRQPIIMVRTANDRYKDLRMEHGCALSLELRDLLIELPENGGNGLRFIGPREKQDDAGLGSTYHADQLAVTIGFRLPHRVRLASGDRNGRRKLRIVHPGIHLWFADIGAIWDLDCKNRDANGSPPRRQAGASAQATLRDDRDILRVLHAISAEWYTAERRTVSWSLRACGFLPDFETEDPTTFARTAVAYPQLGELITTLSAGGRDYIINTPCTSVHYDNVTGVTSWQTDWQDLDFVA